MYNECVEKYGIEAPKHISEILQNARERHSSDFLITHPNGNVDQSWRAFKGKNLEKLILYIIKRCVQDMELGIISGDKLEGKILDKQLSKIKRNVLVDYGEYGCHLPDVDLLVYDPKTLDVLVIMSSKVTLRERIAQTGYWKYKIKENPVTAKIKILFITLDEDSTLTSKTPPKKGRAIAEKDTDGTYVLTLDGLETSSNVKLFDTLIDDIREFSKQV